MMSKAVNGGGTVGNSCAVEMSDLSGQGDQSCVPHDGALPPLHKRKRRAQPQSVNSTIIYSGCQWNPLRGIEMKRDDGLSEGLLGGNEVNSQELAEEDARNEFKLDNVWVAAKLSQEGISWDVIDHNEHRNCKSLRTGPIALREILGVEHIPPKEVWRCTSCKDKV